MARLPAQMLARLRSLSERLRRRRPAAGFAADERGVVAVIFAITFAAIFLAVAIAIDYARTATEYVRVQNAVDSAALAASHQLGLPNQDTQGRTDADAYFKANTAKHKNVGVLDSVALDDVTGQVQAKAHGNMLTSLLKAVGIKVYTIAFRVDDATSRALLTSCASSAAEASDGAALAQVFESIAREIAKLRIAG